MDMSLIKLQEIVKDREAWWAVGHEVTESDRIEPLNNNKEKREMFSLTGKRNRAQ